MVRVVRVIAVVIAAAAAAAQERPRPPRTQQQPDAGAATLPLSREDAELVKELAVLERLELLRNLEFFEDEKETKK
jgi:hypothetical protein